MLVAIELLIVATVPLLRRTGYGAGPLIWVLLGAFAVSAMLLASAVWRLARGRPRRPAAAIGVAPKLCLALASASLVLLALEGVLAVQSAGAAAAPDGSESLLLGLPQAWARRDVEVEGATRAYYWHGVLHVFDGNGMRRTEPFAPRRDDRFRIAVVGDSLTYGYGVEATEAYPAVLERMLEDEYRVEVLDLGVCGYASEDVLDTVARFTPLLQPDLVIYGICQNDFLPRRVGQYASNRAYPFPLPSGLKKLLVEHTRAGAFFDDRYDKLLIRIGLRRDFWDDILLDFRSYRTRFARDLAEINGIVVGRGLPPVIAMVLDQYPALEGRGRRITEYAEQSARAAGMTVVDSAEYYGRFDGRLLHVSRWEGHPNPEAHRAFAEYLLPAVRRTPGLERYRRRPGG